MEYIVIPIFIIMIYSLVIQDFKDDLMIEDEIIEDEIEDTIISDIEKWVEIKKELIDSQSKVLESYVQSAIYYSLLSDTKTVHLILNKVKRDTKLINSVIRNSSGLFLELNYKYRELNETALYMIKRALHYTKRKSPKDITLQSFMNYMNRYPSYDTEDEDNHIYIMPCYLDNGKEELKILEESEMLLNLDKKILKITSTSPSYYYVRLEDVNEGVRE